MGAQLRPFLAYLGAYVRSITVYSAIRDQLLRLYTRRDAENCITTSIMAYVDVEAWSSEHVVAWVRGLHKSLDKTNLQQLVQSRINGSRLMLQTPQDLIELIPTIRIEAFQAILTGISTLRYLKFCSNTETLQSLTLNLACQSRYLYNQLVQAENSPRLLPVSTKTATPEAANRFDFAKVDSNMQINQSTKQRVSLETLDGVSHIVDKIQYVVNWLNLICPQSGQQKFNNDFKCIVLRVAVELASTAQRDQFVEQPNDVLKKTSKFLADYCEWVVLAIDDPDFIQPCWLDILSIKKKAEETDFGIRFQPTSTGELIVDQVVFSSPAHRSGRIAVGDEVIQVDYQTVIGWPQTTVEELIESCKNEVIFTIKKKPVFANMNPSVIVLRPYAIALKRLPSHTSDSVVSIQGDSDSDHPDDLEETMLTRDHDGMNHEPPKEPKGPVYELRSRRRKELKRRVSISGSISDAIVDLSLADSLPIPSLEKSSGAISISGEKLKLTKVSKETLTKSVSHDTAKLYLHTLSIDRKHLWLQQTSEGN